LSHPVYFLCLILYVYSISDPVCSLWPLLYILYVLSCIFSLPHPIYFLCPILYIFYILSCIFSLPHPIYSLCPIPTPLSRAMSYPVFSLISMSCILCVPWCRNSTYTCSFVVCYFDLFPLTFWDHVKHFYKGERYFETLLPNYRPSMALRVSKHREKNALSTQCCLRNVNISRHSRI
jgi:hypothetical protein